MTGSANKSRTASGLGLAAPEPGRRVLLVLDQFEQLFTVADEARRNAFLKALAQELSDPDGQLTVVLTLRADFYDRPLQHPEFSAVFVPGVVHVLPMSAAELEAAVVEPAERVGVKVEPALLAELVAESVAGRGSLPLLQYALTELFDGARPGSRSAARGRSAPRAAGSGPGAPAPAWPAGRRRGPRGAAPAGSPGAKIR